MNWRLEIKALSAKPNNIYKALSATRNDTASGDIIIWCEQVNIQQWIVWKYEMLSSCNDEVILIKDTIQNKTTACTDSSGGCWLKILGVYFF